MRSTVAGTVYERHIGIVTNNEDPEKRGRLLVRCDTLSGASKEFPDWIEPVFPYLSGDGQTSLAGWMWVPDVGVSVEIEIAITSPRDDTVGAVTLDAPSLKWRACLFQIGGDKVHERFTANYPHVRGFVTGAGLGITFDDDLDQMELFDSTGSSLFFDAGTVLLQDEIGSSLLFDDDGITLVSSGDWTVDAGATLFDLGSLDVKTPAVKVYAVTDALTSAALIDGIPAVSFHAKLAAALPELMAVPTMFGIPTVNTAALIGLLAAGTWKSLRISTE